MRLNIIKIKDRGKIMSAIHDLLQQVSDPDLRSRLEQETNRMTKITCYYIITYLKY